MNSKISFGILGCSSVAKNSFIPALLNSKFGSLEMLGSRSLLKSKKFAKKFHCTNYGNYDEILENEKVESVYISLPIGLQEKWIIKAAKAGKHILCEKSSTTSLHSAKKIIRECKKNNVRIMENFSFLFHPQQKKVLELTNSKKFGKIFSFYGKFGFTLNYTPENFRFRKQLGGGILNDVGCYIIRASQFFFQEMPVSIFCNLEYNKKYDIDTNGTISIIFPNGRNALGVFGYSNLFQSNYELWGENAFLDVKRAFNIRKNQPTKISLISEKQSKTFQIKNSDQFTKMINNFCDTIKNNSKNILCEKSFLNQALIMDCARKSAKLKNVVKIN